MVYLKAVSVAVVIVVLVVVTGDGGCLCAAHITIPHNQLFVAVVITVVLTIDVQGVSLFVLI